MEKLSSRYRRKATHLVLLSLISMLFSCEELIEEILKKPQKQTNDSANASANVVYDWYKLISRIQLRSSPQPVVILNNRNFGYIGVGLYQAVRPGIKDAVSLSTKLYQMPEMPRPDRNQEYLWGASANAALASMFKQFLVGLSPADLARIDSMENAYNNRSKLSASDAVISHSQGFGRSIATAIYNWSTSDNFNLSSQGYTPPQFPGAWKPTPPNLPNPVGAFLGNSRPFLTYSLTATTPPLPFPYSEEEESPFFHEARDVYEVGKSLTDEQKAIANWWADAGGSGVGVPAPYHQLSIITNVLESQNAKLGQAAEVYAKTGITMKDGPIIIFRGKYQYNLLRPVTYIQEQIDPTWLPYLGTPPYPEYPSGLAGLFTPAMQVLIREFGDIPVTDNAYTWRGLAPRHYDSISDMIEEAAISRVYAGIHYRFTQYITINMGRELGNREADIHLIPGN